MAGIHKRWLMLAVLFLARTAVAFQFQTVASVRPFLMDALAIDFAGFGLLIGLYLLPGVVISLPSGMLGQRFGAKQIVIVGLALMVVGGVLMGLVSSFAVVTAGRLIAGIGAVFINVLGAKMIADWFVGREIVTAMAISIASWPFGLAVGLVLFGPLAESVGWSAVMHLGALAAFAALLIVLVIYRDPAPSGAGMMRFALNLTRREWLLVVVAGAIWGLFNVAYIVLISFAPELFTVRGYTLPEASRIVSLIGWVLIPSVPLAGFFIERIGWPNLVMVVALAITCAALAVLPFVDAPLTVFALVVLVIGVPAGTIVVLPAQVLRAESRAGGMGVFYTVYYAVMAVLPGAAGFMRDISGSPATPALFAAAMVLACLLGLALFHAARRLQDRAVNS